MSMIKGKLGVFGSGIKFGIFQLLTCILMFDAAVKIITQKFSKPNEFHVPVSFLK